MAVDEGHRTVSVTINGIEIEVPQGELIVESVKRLGLEIPVFCYHPRMKPVGMCRMCLVEIGFKQPDGSVRMMPKPQAGCTLPASEGMVVLTDSESVHRDRKGVLEFLLVNHPLDCPVCDRGGECPLQNNTLAYGPSTSRFIDLKRHLPKAYPLSQYVMLDLERCIQCGRCVRFTEEISGEHELAFRFRGASMQPSTFQLLDFESKFSGNVIEICPVGALTSAQYRFRARPWDLQTTPAVCTACSNGCNVWFDHRAGRFVRINGRINEGVNEEWTCDKGKFGHDYYNSTDRLRTPLVRKGDQFVEATWAEAYEEIVKGLESAGKDVAGLCGTRIANEGLFLFNRLFKQVLGSRSVDHRWTRTLGTSRVQTPIAGIEGKKGVLVFGSNPAEDLPIVFLRLRKAATRNGTQVTVVTPDVTEADAFATVASRIGQGDVLKVAQEIVDGQSELARKVADCLKEDGAIVTSDRVRNLPGGGEALRLLEDLAARCGAEFNCYPTGPNAMGAELLGVLPGDGGLDTWGILQGCCSGTIKALWLLDCDPTTVEGGDQALESAEFLVYQGVTRSEATAFANVVLPMAAPAEQDGTWTNCERRLQRMTQAIAAPGDSKPAWRIFSEVILRLQPSTPFFNPREIMKAIADADPRFLPGASDLPEEGAILSATTQAAMAGDGA